MVHLDTILEGLVEACNDANLLSDQITYSTIVLDREGKHSDIQPPVVEFSVEEVQRDTSRNSELNQTVFDDNGDSIDRVYSRWWDAIISAEVLSVAGTSFTHRGIEQDLRQVLYQFDKHGLDEQIPDPDNSGQYLDNVTEFKLQSINPEMDFATSPSIRTRRLRIDTKFVQDVLGTDLGKDYDQVEKVNQNTGA